MNIRHLRHLLAIAETGSFSRAAERAFITQSALSRSIRALEEELGGPLLDRIGKRNELTALGHDVVVRARAIVLGAEELARSAARFSGPVIRMWVWNAPFSTGAVSVMRGSPAASARIGNSSGALGDRASSSRSAPGKRLAVCMSAPMPKSSTEIGRCGARPSASAASWSSGWVEGA